MPATMQASTATGHVSSGTLPPTDVPDDVSEMWKLAEALSKADTGLPKQFRGNPGNLLALMLRARALNIPLAVAWDELYGSGDGRMRETATLVRALARRAGHRIAYVEADDYHAVALIQCAGETAAHEVSFTIQDAQREGLTDPEYNSRHSYWDQRPKNMLIARVTTRGVNWYCPEVLLGLGGYLHDDEDDASEVPADVITTRREERRAKVDETLRAAKELEQQDDGHTRLNGLRMLFLQAREDEVLDHAVDDNTGHSVRHILTEKMRAADELSKTQRAESDSKPEKPAQAATKTRKKSTRKTAPKTPADQHTTPDSPQEENRPASQTDGQTAGRPAGQTDGQAEGNTLPCGCAADDVIRHGTHNETCTDPS